MAQIIEQKTDLSGKISIRAMLPNGDTVFLYFDEQPLQEQVDEQVCKIEQQQNQPMPSNEATTSSYLRELKAELLNTKYQGLDSASIAEKINANSASNSNIPVWKVAALLTDYGVYAKIYDSAANIDDPNHSSSCIVKDMLHNPNFSTVDMNSETINNVLNSFTPEVISDEFKIVLTSMTNELPSRSQILFGHEVLIDDVDAAKRVTL